MKNYLMNIITEDETMRIIKEIEKLMESGVKYEYEPDVPN
jgi:hypothetical protein